MCIKPSVSIIRAGLISYNVGLKLQNIFCEQAIEHKQNERNYLILQEYYPVYTIGIRTKNYAKDEEIRLRNLGADFYRTNRGGLITFHGPGQLVAYPILHLKRFKLGMRWYVSNLERMIMETCHEMGVLEATTTENTGIWVKDKKICAIGVHVSRYVTSHGISLNCCTDLKWFEHIIPCGIVGKGVTSLTKELNRHVTVQETADILTKVFSVIFNCQMLEHNFKLNS